MQFSNKQSQTAVGQANTAHVTIIHISEEVTKELVCLHV